MKVTRAVHAESGSKAWSRLGPRGRFVEESTPKTSATESRVDGHDLKKNSSGLLETFEQIYRTMHGTVVDRSG